MPYSVEHLIENQGNIVFARKSDFMSYEAHKEPSTQITLKS